jgi:hypothetical protein
MPRPEMKSLVEAGLGDPDPALHSRQMPSRAVFPAPVNLFAAHY